MIHIALHVTRSTNKWTSLIEPWAQKSPTSFRPLDVVSWGPHSVIAR